LSLQGVRILPNRAEVRHSHSLFPTAAFETQPITPYLTPIKPTGRKDRSYWNSGRRKFKVMVRYTNVAADNFSCLTTAHLHHALL